MEMKEIKKKLLAGKIRITSHATKRLNKRGYAPSDIISCIWNGKRTKVQAHNNKITFVIEGQDRDGYPIVVVVGKDDKKADNLAIVTVFPPIDDKFERTI